MARAFASADVTTADSTMAGFLDPHTLSMLGRSLIRNGEYVAVIKMGMESNTPRLATAASWDVRGGANPSSWVYRLSLAGPSHQTTIENLPAAGVVHVRYSSDPGTPWRGVGPLQSARLAGRLSAEVSTALADELSGPRGALLPLPNVSGDDPEIDLLKADIKGAGRRARVRRVTGRSIRIGSNHQPVIRLAVAAARGGYSVRFNRSGKARLRGSGSGLRAQRGAVGRFNRNRTTGGLPPGASQHGRAIGPNRIC